MKLRNKKTGEIVDLQEGVLREINNGTQIEIRPDACDWVGKKYNSLAEVNEEWEDYEEPKEYYWYIDDLGIVSIDRVDSSMIEMRKNFGNYFETREEAEKAAEKLKAWKWLKDKGFRFNGINEYDGSIKTTLTKQQKIKDSVEFYEDMTLLFGGEE